MPDALRQILNDALQNELDKKILVRTSDGLLDFGTDPDTPASASNYAAYSDAMFEAVDGLYANMIGDNRMQVGSSIYAHMGKTYRNANAPDSGLEVLARQSGGVRVSGNVPAYANNFQDAVVCKGPACRNCVAAMWDGIFFEDMYTRAAEG